MNNILQDFKGETKLYQGSVAQDQTWLLHVLSVVETI